jgi:hypothetical protein
VIGQFSNKTMAETKKMIIKKNLKQREVSDRFKCVQYDIRIYVSQSGGYYNTNSGEAGYLQQNLVHAIMS